jgi:acylphosphatase
VRRPGAFVSVAPAQPGVDQRADGIAVRVAAHVGHVDHVRRRRSAPGERDDGEDERQAHLPVLRRAHRFVTLGAMSDAVRRHVRAHGRVQGVFFRDSVRREAARRGVAGWARNRLDGTAEAVFEGPPEAVDAMVEFVRRGPGHAEVSSVDVADEAPEGLTGFDIC